MRSCLRLGWGGCVIVGHVEMGRRKQGKLVPESSRSGGEVVTCNRCSGSCDDSETCLMSSLAEQPCVESWPGKYCVHQKGPSLGGCPSVVAQVWWMSRKRQIMCFAMYKCALKAAFCIQSAFYGSCYVRTSDMTMCEGEKGVI